MIDWNGKPEGAQRHNENLAHKWLKRKGDTVSYYHEGRWSCYSEGIVGIYAWNNATHDPRVAPTPTPTQLSWKDAKPEATHIMQNLVSSNQEFAISQTNNLFVRTCDRSTIYNMDKWFVVSERPVDTVKEVYYIAGPMTGHAELNRPAFNAESHRLTLNGHTVLNPATLPDGLTQAQYMDICLAMLRCATRIRMLDGWEKSEGARIEHALAVKSLIKVEYTK
tara:strand:+ start:51 stop:716 length:666 start_codon:yes stop_codon:yes gene_type:complete